MKNAKNKNTTDMNNKKNNTKLKININIDNNYRYACHREPGDIQILL